MNTQFQTSDRTGKFVLALQKLSEAQDAVLDAMSESYGEHDGELMTERLGFDDINNSVLQCMRVAILENLNDNPTTI